MAKSDSKAVSTPNKASDTIEDFIKLRRKATINDVARLARVSKKTVSRVINKSPSVRGETRDSVNEVINKIGFRPDPQARGLAFRRSFLLGLIYDNPNAQYIVNMQMGALDGLRGTGTELVVHPCDRHSDNFIEEIREFVERQRLAGVIVLPPIADDHRLLDLLDDLEVPYVRITARAGELNSPPIDSPQIVSRDREGCAMAGEHIAQLGHTRIGYIAGNQLYPSAHERRAGFEIGLARHGLKIAPDLDEAGDYSFESGYQAALKILRNKDRPSAIICCNDEMASGAYRATYELGLSIPGDVTLIGFDDAPVSMRIFPPLTTVRLPTRDMGRTAAHMLISEDPDHDTTIVFDATLLVRASSGPKTK